jgi:hypothetical protein
MKCMTTQLAAGIGIAVLWCGVPEARAQIAPSLGAAASFAVLGSSTVTNTGSSTITGDLGVYPGTAVVGFPPGTVAGTIQAGTGAALAAQTSVTTAWDNLTSQGCTQDLTGQNLGGLTLTPGVYCFSTSAPLVGTLMLNAQGNAAATWVFKIGSTLITGSGSSTLVINGGSACNVFWQVGSSATLGTTTSFVGNILAAASITLTTGASLIGRALARGGAVTLDSNNISNAQCAVPVPALPVPFVLLLAATLLGAGYLALRRRAAVRTA